MSEPLRIGGPAWWCDPCRTWWPGGWGPLYLGDPPTAEQEADDLARYHHLTNRTCAECGQPLVPRTRTVAVVNVRTVED